MTNNNWLHTIKWIQYSPDADATNVVLCLLSLNRHQATCFFKNIVTLRVNCRSTVSQMISKIGFDLQVKVCCWLLRQVLVAHSTTNTFWSCHLPASVCMWVCVLQWVDDSCWLQGARTPIDQAQLHVTSSVLLRAAAATAMALRYVKNWKRRVT